MFRLFTICAALLAVVASCQPAQAFPFARRSVSKQVIVQKNVAARQQVVVQKVVAQHVVAQPVVAAYAAPVAVQAVVAQPVYSQAVVAQPVVVQQQVHGCSSFFVK